MSCRQHHRVLAVVGEQVQVMPAWVRSGWEREGIALPQPELMLSGAGTQGKSRIKPAVFSAVSSSRLR